MKELAIEEKAKRYDEALEWMRDLYPTLKGEEKERAERLFPELKESEDEIMKSLIAFFAKFKPNDMWNDDFSFGDIVTWLEKQGEQILANSAKTCKNEAWGEEDEHRVKDTIYFIDTAKKHYASIIEIDACIDWLKSTKAKNRIGG